ncbi:transposase, partial [Francisella tularensis subsp. holarctica]|nr:transposase [Francisella tularensis subsp. holarctica]
KDNFHKYTKIIEIAKKFLEQILYLNQYSQDINPIEKFWSNYKKIIIKEKNIIEKNCYAITYKFNKILS